MNKLFTHLLMQFVISIRMRLLIENKNWLCFIGGSTGSGKSWDGLELARRIDRTFNIIDRLVFDIESFMALLNSGRLMKGNLIVFDEAGVGIPAREWWSVSNKAINYVLQTFRHNNLGVIFTAPSFDFIDSHTRKLFHTYIETTQIDKIKEVSIVKPYNISYSPRLGEIYWQFPNANYNGSNIQMNELEIPKPPKNIIDAYEIKKKEFTSKLNKEIEVDIKKVRDQMEYKPQSPHKIAKEIVDRGLYMKSDNGKINLFVNDIILEFNCSYQTARLVKSIVIKQLENLGEREKIHSV